MATRGKSAVNPFRIHGVVRGESFADRKTELGRLEAALTAAGSKLIVYGPRRMGKTSTLLRAVERVNAAGGHALFADLSTASSAADMSNRILAAAGGSLGRSLRDFITDLVARLKMSISLTADPATGLILPALDFQARDWEVRRQRESITEVLDALEALAKKRGIVIGIVLDEFQEITTIGGTKADWHLRGTVQRHEHLAYVFAGSHTHLIERMTAADGALYKLADKLPFGAIDPAVFAAWIDRRFRAAGLETTRVGAACCDAGGPRTRDIMQLARACYDRSRAQGHASVSDVEAALREIVAEEQDLHYMQWRALTPLQQNVLRAVAVGDGGLTTQAVLRRFSLGSTGAATNAAAALVARGLLLRDDTARATPTTARTGYTYDSPFFRAWVWWHALADLGAGFSGTVREGPLRYVPGST